MLTISQKCLKKSKDKIKPTRSRINSSVNRTRRNDINETDDVSKLMEDLTKHKMDAEEAHIDEACANQVNDAKERKAKVCAVGTTVMRSIETSLSSVWQNESTF